MADPSTLNELFFHLREVAAGRSLLVSGPVASSPADGGRETRPIERRSTADFVRSVHSLTLALEAERIVPGDRVALMLGGRPEWHEVDFACHLLGAVVVPLDPSAPIAELERALRNSGATWWIHAAGHRAVAARAAAALPQRPRRVVLDGDPAADEVDYVRLLGRGAEEIGAVPLERFRGRVRPDALASIVYTSGTTGPPKGVMSSHASLMAGAASLGRLLPLERSDRLSTELSPAHGFQRTLSSLAFLRGTQLVYRSLDEAADPLSSAGPDDASTTVLAAGPATWQRWHDELSAEIERAPRARRHLLRRGVAVGRRHAEARRTGFVGPFLALRRGLAERLVSRRLRARFGRALRFGVAAGAPLRPEVGDFFEALGLPVFEGYGVTETAPLIAASRPRHRRQGAVGKLLDEVEVRIAADGEILVRSAGVMQGYWREPGATEESIDASGWLHTGDLGSVDRSGYLYVTDRKRDLVVLESGHAVTPRPIEALLRAEPGIAQAVVVGEGRPWPVVLVLPEDLDVEEDPAVSNRDAENLPAAAGTSGAVPASVVAASTVPASAVPASAVPEARRRAIDDALERVGERLADENRPRAWALLAEPLRRETGELGPTDQIRRQVVARRHADAIDALYRSALSTDTD